MLCISYVFFVFNFLLFLGGAAAAGLGIWILTDPTVMQEYITLPIDQIYVVTCIVTVTGFVLVIVGFIGCCGALMENACCLCLFCTITVILLIVGAIVAIVVWVALNNETLRNKIKDEVFKEFNGSDVFENLQRNLKCCGVEGTKDYTNVGRPIPASCKDVDGTFFKMGCWEKIRNTIEEKAKILGGMSATLAVLGIISAVVSLVILCSVRQASKAI